MKLFKRTLPSQISLDYANMIMENKIVLFKIWKPYEFKDQLSWKEDPYGDKTWRFYLHCLRMVSFLTNAYEMTNDNKYLSKAEWFIKSWMKHNPNPNDNVSEWAWSGHGTANRLLNLIYFWTEYSKSSIFDEEFSQQLFTLLDIHGEFLTDKKNYEDYNHGIFQDQALLELSVIFNEFPRSSQWQKTAIARLLARFNKDVSESGIHREHSPAYHIVVLNLFLEIKDFMDYYSISYPKVFHKKINLMQEYLAYITKDNGFLPLVGDTGQSNTLNSIKKDHIINEYWAYRSSKGKKGIKPNIPFRVYLDSGTAIYRSDYQDFPQESIYWLFTNCFNSVIHKHADDLSFDLRYKNTDYIVDSGRFNYKEADEYRKYFRSVFAHNSIAVDGKTYPLNSSQIGKSILLNSVEKNDSFYAVQGFHELYKDIKVFRSLIQYKDKALIIHDRIYSNTNHNYTQIFNIGKDVEILKNDSTNYRLNSKINDSYIKLQQLDTISKSNQYFGSTDPIYGWQSSDFNEKHPINVIHFNKEGSTVNFLTLITFAKNSNIENVIVTNKNNIYSYLLQDINGKVLSEIFLKDFSNEELHFEKVRQYGKCIEPNNPNWEVFAVRKGYKVVRINLGLDKKKIKNNYYVQLNNQLLETRNANFFDKTGLADFYSNGCLYISIANANTGWDEQERPSSTQIYDYFRKNTLLFRYLDS